MLLALLGIIDILAGISLIYPNFLAFYIGIIIILKGVSSMLGVAAGNLVIVILGIIDVVAGISLVLGLAVPWIWLLLIVKGFFSLVSGLGR